ncbi:MAG: nucleotidyl transferase AbiEii/AbiGii toxin family protein [Cyanobacteriota bacterium]
MKAFRPHLEILPQEQRCLWPTLVPLASSGWVLYGGTAIALRYGQRVSVDFDFFSAHPLDRQALALALPWLASARVLQDQPETLTMLTSGALIDGVKVSFFGGLAIGRVADPEITGDGVARVASPLDLLATKLKVLLQRAESKDYIDVATLLESGLGLADGLAAATALYGSSFPPEEVLKALVYYADGDLPELPAAIRRRLEAAVIEVDSLPTLARRGSDLSGGVDH